VGILEHGQGRPGHGVGFTVKSYASFNLGISEVEITYHRNPDQQFWI